MSTEYLTDPYPIANELRDEHYVLSEQLGHLVVTDMDLIEEVFMTPDVYASSNVQDPIAPLCPAAQNVLGAPDFNSVAVMSNRQEPDHAASGSHSSGVQQSTIESLEDYMRSRATKLLDEMIGNGSPAEFVQQFAFLFLLKSCSGSSDFHLKMTA